MIGPFPNLLIMGVPKAGTSSLYTWLASHPQALGSHVKETCFFADPDSHTFRADFNVRQGLEKYPTAFPKPQSGTRILFEATPTYIYSQTALAHVPDLPSAPRCVFVVRDPASQILSLFGYFRDNWDHIPATMSFSEFLVAVAEESHGFAGNELAARALTYADYLPWLNCWHERLGPDRMMVCTFDRLRADPAGLMIELATFCGLDPSHFADYGFPITNETYSPKSRLLHHVNIALRERLPKGRLYEMARRGYRRLNTRAPDRLAEDKALERLRHDFVSTNQKLAAAYDLDLTGWLP
jgi:hypothetical protein